MGVGGDRMKKATTCQLHQKFNPSILNDGETIMDYTLRLSSMAVYLTMLDEEVKDSMIIAKMLLSLPPHFKHITIEIKTLFDVSIMSVVDLIGWLKVVEEAFEEALTSLQQNGKLFLTEDEWDAQSKKHE
jgi:Glu-tRNA(Gln) amidotransferase subunit E-like FAD-binding protein